MFSQNRARRCTRRQNNASLFIDIFSIKMELFVAFLMALCATCSETIGAFGNFREIREERGEIPKSVCGKDERFESLLAPGESAQRVEF